MSGLLNKLITNGTVQEIAEVPGTTYSMVNILVINPTAGQVDVRLFASNQAAPTPVDTIEHRAVLAENGGRVEYSCVNCSAGEKLFIQAPAGLIVRVTSVDEE